MNQNYEINKENNEYEDEKRKNKQRLVRNEFKGVGKIWNATYQKTKN